MRIALAEALTRSGHSVVTAANGEEGLKMFGERSPQIVISDVRMPKMTGIELLCAIRRSSTPETPFVLITAYGAIDDAVAAMKEGATDYILKPFSADTLDDLMRRVFGEDGGGVKAISARPAERLGKGSPSRGRVIVTGNEKMKKVMDILRRVAPSKSTVLIHGESGVGKELVARFIHENSDRRDRPFIAVNCAAMPETLLESELFGHEKGSFTGAIARKIGKFELANGGVILLDEVTEMDPQLQAKLLRVLQEEEIDRVGGASPIPLDIRVIATTNRDMDQAVKEGKFREDLYFRLNVIPVNIPPLRERPDDIPILVEYFIKKFNAIMGKAVCGVEPEAMDSILANPWRGNIRELENVMERAVLLAVGDSISLADLMMDGVKSAGSPKGEAEDLARPGITVAEMEKKLIMRTLDDAQGNRTKAAEALGVSIRTLRNKLNEYNVAHGK
ncbi:MAG: sigma-54-dependent Fis family transcriptional regulator [Nitrospinae bacterium]|nr:sigma-54-dependent Fis family transcriptional regulator [Nitrospinota bacterium]